MSAKDRDLSPDVVIALDGVTVTRGGNDLLRSVTYTVELDERWVVLGPNGAGKTTLLNLIAGGLHPTSGTAYILGERLGRTDISELRTRIGLSTAALAERIPPAETVHNVVLTAAWAVVGRFRERYDELDEERARSLLKQLGVAQLYGLSTQESDYQREAAERLHLPFPILSDANLELTGAIGLPTFDVAGMTLLKRMAWVIEDGTIVKAFYPVFPPDKSAEDVVAWLGASR